MRLKILFFLTILIGTGLFAQEVKLLPPGPRNSFRGMSVVNDKVVWVSGSKGTVGKSTDGGETWEWMTVKGYEKCDFRDIEAFSKKEAIIMAVAEPAYIFRTTDGGKSWEKVFEDKTPGMFLDAMDFYDRKNGIVVGDPINGHFFIAYTVDGGKSWLNSRNDYPVDSGEACFASSGSNIIFRPGNSFALVTGGTESVRLFCNRLADSMTIYGRVLPLLQGKSSTGANSIAEKNYLTQVVVGGDFTLPDSVHGNCSYSSDGMNWNVPETPPTGYRSCVEYLWEDAWICCGLNGVDISEDNGKHWRPISKLSFHVCQRSKSGSAVFFIGNDGQIGKLVHY